MAKPRRKPRDWAKIYLAWFTTPNHAHLSDSAHAVGTLLVILANRSKEWGSVLAIQGHSAASTVAKILGRAIDAVESALSELAQVGTINVHPDGSVSFPNFESWQESPSAERMRNKRARDATPYAAQPDHNDVTVTAYARSGLSICSLDPISEGEIEGESAAPPSAPPPRAAAQASLGPPTADPFDATDLIQAWEETRAGGMIPQLILGPREAGAVRKLRQPLGFWRDLFQRAAESPFLRGERTGFVCSLGWAIENHALILSGRYDGKHRDSEHPQQAMLRRFMAEGTEAALS